METEDQEYIMGLALYQPWATLIEKGIKKVETRGWKTAYRGDVIITSCKRQPKKAKEAAIALLEELDCGINYEDLPFGTTICLATISDVKFITMELRNSQSEQEILVGDWSIGRYAWFLTNIRPAKKNPIKNNQGLFPVLRSELEVIDEDS